ncbi:hypothetical protein NUW58_g10620 [Xylaria curta]|uniref:Uncharacterized protein n=1 Tax=Xylaria curta TaxID=42375 RepID=A0ACC1MJ01_9PEZI|nr:hypothetical protein NUW58_g10620 [Xylaria curta]
MHHNKKIEEAVHKDLIIAGKKASLSGLELISGVVIVDDEWTPAGGLVTATQRATGPPYQVELERAVNILANMAMNLDLSNAAVMKDEQGRPFIVVRDQGRKKRQFGNEAVKSHILAARTVSNIVKTSLGPHGLDKILISPDGDITVTNDGATILQQMEISNHVAKLLVSWF